MTSFVHLNGEFVRESDAFVSVDDGGWLHGAGLFETMHAVNGQIFRLAAHLERLKRSAASLLVPIESGVLPDEDTFVELLELNHLTTARVRLTVTAGSMRGEDAEGAARFSVCITALPLTRYPPELYEKGVAVALCDHRVSPSDPIAGHKTTSYLPRLLGLRRAQLAQCFEALWFTTTRHLAEGSITNVFIVKDGLLETPPLDTPVLPGVARSVVLELARTIDVEAQEVPLTINDLLDADEILLTNSIIQVMPVIRVEKHDIGEGRVGPLAKKLLEEYRACVARECA